MDLDKGFRILINEGADAASLSPAEILADHAAGSQDDREVGIDILGGRRVGGDVKAGFAVGEVKAAIAVGDRVGRSGLEEARRAGMIFAWARPEDPQLLVDFFIGDAGVIRDSPGRSGAQLLEDLARVGEGEALLAPERAGDILNDAPVLTG